MRVNTNGSLVVALVVVVGLLVLFGGGAMTGGHMGGAMTGGHIGGGMMGTAWMGGFGWMWIPAVLTVGLVVLLARGMVGKKP